MRLIKREWAHFLASETLFVAIFGCDSELQFLATWGTKTFLPQNS